MKSTHLIILFLFTCLFSQSVLADKIPITGEWDESGLRSSMPSPPEVYLENGILSVYFVDALSDLTITLRDSNGNLVYQAPISSPTSGKSFIVPVSLSAGEYTIVLSHYWGILTGQFEIE